VGGFNLRCSEGGEDTDWFLRLIAADIEAWFTPQAIVRHLVPDYRMTADYLRWVSLRQGWAAARNQVDHRGLFLAGLIGLAKLGQAGVQHVPQLWVARAAGQCNHVLFRRCRLWRVMGFGRFLLRKILPGLFPQQAFRSWIEFRSEREQFATTSIPTAIAR
jgi:hypothetical protein